MSQTNNFKFFQNIACEYFPCHKGIDPKDFNCLWCFCPWYYDCGSKKETKCENCTFPHQRNHYDWMIQGIKSISERNVK
jgi:Zn-finger protein